MPSVEFVHTHLVGQAAAACATSFASLPDPAFIHFAHGPDTLGLRAFHSLVKAEREGRGLVHVVPLWAAEWQNQQCFFFGSLTALPFPVAGSGVGVTVRAGSCFALFSGAALRP